MQYKRKTGIEKKIDELREAPVSRRKRVAFMVSLLATLCVAAVWATVIMPNTFSNNEDKLASGGGSSPFEQFMSDSQLVVEDIRSGAAELKELVSSLFSEGDPNVEPTTEGSRESNEDESGQDTPTRNGIPLETYSEEQEGQNEESRPSEETPPPPPEFPENGSSEGETPSQTSENMVE